MPLFIPKEADFQEVFVEGKNKRVLSRAKFEDFDASLLGLGDLTLPAYRTDAVAAVFCLEGFAEFSRKIEPHPLAQLLISEFLSWLMEQFKIEIRQKDHASGVILWSPLPFFVKFTGDGLLALWDATEESDTGLRNLIVNSLEICRKYPTAFLTKFWGRVIDEKVGITCGPDLCVHAPGGIKADLPRALRCGISRGLAYSVGEGSDYTGSCLHLAARLHELPGISFCFARRGFDLEHADKQEWFKKNIVIRKISMAGFGDMLVGVLKTEWQKMKSDDKRRWRQL
jgi:class 3 adenylate cyclase